jgi:chromosome segregation ATPase
MARDLATLEQQLRQQQATAAALILENERCERAARDAVDEAQELRQTVQGLQNRLLDLQQDLSQVHKARRQEQHGVDSATQTEKNSNSEVEVVNLRDQLAGKTEVIRILKEGKARLAGDLASLERLARQAEHEVTRLRHKLHQSGFAHSL